jgi:hypothetical protein
MADRKSNNRLKYSTEVYVYLLKRQQMNAAALPVLFVLLVYPNDHWIHAGHVPWTKGDLFTTKAECEASREFMRTWWTKAAEEQGLSKFDADDLFDAYTQCVPYRPVTDEDDDVS